MGRFAGVIQRVPMDKKSATTVHLIARIWCQRKSVYAHCCVRYGSADRVAATRERADCFHVLHDGTILARAFACVASKDNRRMARYPCRLLTQTAGALLISPHECLLRKLPRLKPHFQPRALT